MANMKKRLRMPGEIDDRRKRQRNDEIVFHMQKLFSIFSDIAHEGDRPAQMPARPVADIDVPSTQVVDGDTDSVLVRGAEPVVAATEPVVAATEPVVAATEPVVAATEPVVAATEPVVAATEPVVAATEPGASVASSTDKTFRLFPKFMFSQYGQSRRKMAHFVYSTIVDLAVENPTVSGGGIVIRSDVSHRFKRHFHDMNPNSWSGQITHQMKPIAHLAQKTRSRGCLAYVMSKDALVVLRNVVDALANGTTGKEQKTTKAQANATVPQTAAAAVDEHGEGEDDEDDDSFDDDIDLQSEEEEPDLDIVDIGTIDLFPTSSSKITPQPVAKLSAAVRPFRPAQTSRSPAQTSRSPAQTSRSPAQTSRSPAQTSRSPAQWPSAHRSPAIQQPATVRSDLVQALRMTPTSKPPVVSSKWIKMCPTTQLAGNATNTDNVTRLTASGQQTINKRDAIWLQHLDAVAAFWREHRRPPLSQSKEGKWMSRQNGRQQKGYKMSPWRKQKIRERGCETLFKVRPMGQVWVEKRVRAIEQCMARGGGLPNLSRASVMWLKHQAKQPNTDPHIRSIALRLGIQCA
jgi:hypothetical protein